MKEEFDTYIFQIFHIIFHLIFSVFISFYVLIFFSILKFIFILLKNIKVT